MEEGTARRFTCLSSASLMRFRSSPAPPAAPSPKKTTIQLATLLLRLPRWPPVHAGSANGEARARVRVRARKRGEEHGRGSGPGAAAGAAPASGEVCKLGRIPDTELQARGSNRNRTQQLPLNLHTQTAATTHSRIRNGGGIRVRPSHRPTSASIKGGPSIVDPRQVPTSNPRKKEATTEAKARDPILARGAILATGKKKF